MPAPFKPPPASCSPDDVLLESWSAQLCDNGEGESRAAGLLSVARQFLEWWRRQYVGDRFRISAAAGNWPRHAEAWRDMRENFLRSRCPDHRLRMEQRAGLDAFFHFIVART
jgi:hypothetical protein